MSYEVRVDHPESDERRAANWTSWSFWAEKNAPFTGVSIDQQARILNAVCPRDVSGEICQALDTGGTLTAPQARIVLQTAEPVMTDLVAAVYRKAADDGYGIKVEFKRGAFDAPSASEYLANAASA